MEAYANSMVYIDTDLTSTASGNPGDQFLFAFDVHMLSAQAGAAKLWLSVYLYLIPVSGIMADLHCCRTFL